MVERTDTYEDYTAHLLEALDENGMSQVDFDQLIAWLREQQRIGTQRDHLETEMMALKDDYRQRIAGMVKAIAAVSASRESPRDAMTLIDSLATMSAEELILCYRRTSGRFRDHFPASYGLLATNSGRNQDLSVYK